MYRSSKLTRLKVQGSMSNFDLSSFLDTFELFNGITFLKIYEKLSILKKKTVDDLVTNSIDYKYFLDNIFNIIEYDDNVKYIDEYIKKQQKCIKCNVIFYGGCEQFISIYKDDKECTNDLCIKCINILSKCDLCDRIYDPYDKFYWSMNEHDIDIILCYHCK